MFKILLSACILHSFSIAKETVDSTVSELKPLIEKTDGTQDRSSSSLQSTDEITERVTAVEFASTPKFQAAVRNQGQVMYLLTLNSPTAQTIEAPGNPIKETVVNINPCLNTSSSTAKNPSSIGTPTTRCTPRTEDPYFQSYRWASEIFPIPD
ncbi:hypothetical protein [Candidatus Odyssella acanthamoebae]|uniref:Uncharacterized protein n=1 Tax=Candidatus Odyssella acanthamoebae TaxID=91604 RepID=A0A077AV78_9PROT|nr:hypothetical protein [Candidatus Paracaedibacter acanthamoebae]AIK95929.1 hypothetical protein ID47_03025 [Candidatus Paracaedibacter acanthamoebae]